MAEQDEQTALQAGNSCFLFTDEQHDLRVRIIKNRLRKVNRTKHIRKHAYISRKDKKSSKLCQTGGLRVRTN